MSKKKTGGAKTMPMRVLDEKGIKYEDKPKTPRN